MRIQRATAHRDFAMPHGRRVDGPDVFSSARIVLVGIQSNMAPPLLFGEQLLQRMGVICTGRNEANLPDDADGGIHVLPPLRGRARKGEAHPPRLVRGEIFRCERGTFYEHCRGQIRPLHQLFAGPRGEILELTGGEESARKETAERPSDSDEPAFRVLFAEPGERHMVTWGDFKDVLGGQIRHSERLRETHQLPCNLQVYEVIKPQTIEALASAVLGKGAEPSQLRPLTAELARKLRIAEAECKVAASAAGVLARGERLFRLRVLDDPTIEVERPANRRSATTGAASARKGIPECYLKPWEFRFTRDEVIYDMNVTGVFQGAFTDALRRLARWPRWRAELRKWQVLLCNKNFDEQLWSIRPPGGGLNHRAVRQWAERTLEMAGYDPRLMLLEWEVFWRRKGV